MVDKYSSYHTLHQRTKNDMLFWRGIISPLGLIQTGHSHWLVLDLGTLVFVEYKVNNTPTAAVLVGVRGPGLTETIPIGLKTRGQGFTYIQDLGH